MTTQSPLRMIAIVARPEDMSVAGDGTLQRYAAEGIDITVMVAVRRPRRTAGDRCNART